jgi:hypothetical protein
MTIKETHDLLLFELNKNEYGYISHSEIDDVLHRAQMEEFKFLLGDEREFTAGAPLGRTAFGISQALNNALLPFVEKLTYNDDLFDGVDIAKSGAGSTSISAEAYLLLPEDWLYTLEFVLKNVDLQRIDIIPQGKIHRRRHSRINTTEFWTYAGAGGTLTVHPFENKAYRRYNFSTSGVEGTLFYLRKPVKPLFFFTQSGRVINHDPTLSTDMEWDDMHINKIIVRALILLGINVENQNVVAINRQKNKD